MGRRPGPNLREPDHDAVLQFIRRHTKPFVSTADVLEEFGTVTHRTIYSRLRDLEERGDIERYSVSGRANVWHLPVQFVEEASASMPASESQ